MAYRLGIGSMPVLPKHFCRCEIVAPFGRRTLSVPVEGGRKLIRAGRYAELLLSEHGGWRHTHFDTIASAYGSSPYFHYYEDDLREIYDRRYDTLEALCLALHKYIDRAASLDSCVEWLLKHRQADGGLIENASGVESDCDMTLSMLHLLYEKGPESIFTLLPKK